MDEYVTCTAETFTRLSLCLVISARGSTIQTANIEHRAPVSGSLDVIRSDLYCKTSISVRQQ